MAEAVMSIDEATLADIMVSFNLVTMLDINPEDYLGFGMRNSEIYRKMFLEKTSRLNPVERTMVVVLATAVKNRRRILSALGKFASRPWHDPDRNYFRNSTFVKLVNFIRARGLQHRQFIAFLEETDADHQDLLYHSRVRWLSLGKVLQRVWELKDDIIAFLELMGKSDEFPELSDKNWLSDFAFAVDILSHMNELNVKLQGKDLFVHDMYTHVKAFISKLTLFSRQIANKSFAHFPTLAMQEEAPRNAKKYSKSLEDLHGEFCRRFSDFEKIEQSLQLVSCPLSQDPETAPEELQLELIDLQSDSVLKEKFNSVKLNDFYASLNRATFPNLRRTAQKMLTLFK
ncbi:PREDICTED: general transcription factor II-I repeat domain-containing protein 2-like [Priapulus caudatus]|uniref:General transcription factor II-I repeat domain-containing protein 2-like n=1 Tax=Priapulus caudatus TaxID=37621 RepID=A0ABM1EF48_PRICU|nr:PREDICTED: general transcription factor II-I repeat domain-containing protein 2-like [Priapulus caudatus]